ncbi:MAG: hypothetical protein LBC61_07800 [Candidatus Peribacteria bacterium]|nr:hypothetical protein [Candidatus Peribacteria bacterium]
MFLVEISVLVSFLIGITLGSTTLVSLTITSCLFTDSQLKFSKSEEFI